MTLLGALMLAWAGDLVAVPERARIGERIELSFAFAAPAGSSLEWSALSLPESVELLDRELALGADGTARARVWLMPIDLGRFELGPLVIDVDAGAGRVEERRSPVVEIVVQAAGAEPAREFPPRMSPLPAPEGGGAGWRTGLAAGGLVLLATAGWLVRRRRRRPGPAPATAEDPRRAALAALEVLRRETEAGEERASQVVPEVVEVLRVFLAEALPQVPVAGQTTEELFGRFETASGPLDREAALHGLFAGADLVKFAIARATAAEARRALEAARDFVERAGLPDAPREVPP